MDITIKGIEGLTEQEIKEWVAVLVERKENAKLNAVQAVSDAVKTFQASVDGFRKANALEAKFEKVEEVEPIAEPVEPVKE